MADNLLNAVGDRIGKAGFKAYCCWLEILRSERLNICYVADDIEKTVKELSVEVLGKSKQEIKLPVQSESAFDSASANSLNSEQSNRHTLEPATMPVFSQYSPLESLSLIGSEALHYEGGIESHDGNATPQADDRVVTGAENPVSVHNENTPMVEQDSGATVECEDEELPQSTLSCTPHSETTQQTKTNEEQIRKLSEQNEEVKRQPNAERESNKELSEKIEELQRQLSAEKEKNKDLSEEIEGLKKENKLKKE